MLFAVLSGVVSSDAQTNPVVTVRHAPSLNGPGRIEGSVQQLLGENVTFNGGFTLTGDLLVPGTPTLKINGSPHFAGTIIGAGSAAPAGYQVTLNGNVMIGYLRTRINPVALPTVPPPPAPAGTRSVTINSAGQSYGDPATLRNLTLNANVGPVAIPPGTYGNFTANGGSGFTFGTAGATTPGIYRLQNLSLNGSTRIDVIGPIILTVAGGFTANGVVGTTNQSAWLQLQLACGGLTLNGGSFVHAHVTAPAGTVIVNGNSCLTGTLKSDRLILNGNGCIKAGAGAGNQPPIANAQSVTTAEDTARNLTLTGSDPESAPLIYTILSPPTRGSLSGTAPNLVYAPALNENGADSFTFKVNDGAQDSAAATVAIIITPVNDAPTAQPQSISTAEDTPAPITLAGSDIEGSPLSYRIVTSPQHGTLSGVAPDLVYFPDANYNGPDSFTFRVNDGQLDSASAKVSITVSPLNDRPVADAQSLSTDEDTALPITLTGTDIENDPLTYTVLTAPAHGTLSGVAPDLTYTPATNYFGADRFTFRVEDGSTSSAPATISLTVRPVNDRPVAFAASYTTPEDTAINLTLTATDIEDTNLTYVIVTSPTHGTLTGTGKNLVYSPVADFHGADSFTFKASDGELDSIAVSITLTVTPVNDPPVAEARTVVTDEDTPVTIVLTGTDVDGEALTFVVATQPAHGTLTGTPPNLVYTPAANYHGPDSFTHFVNDGSMSSVPATVTVTISSINDPPVATPDNVSTDEDTTVAITLTGSDADDDALVFSVVTTPTRGTLSGTPPNLMYTPQPDFNGSDTFTFAVSDGQTSSAPAAFNIVVRPVNDAPVASSQTLSTRENVPVPVQLTGADVDGDALVFTVMTPPAHGALAGAPPDLVYVPAPDYAGSDFFTFIASDGQLNSAAAIVSIAVTPVNHAPLVDAGADQTITLAESALLNGVALDDGLPLGSSVTAEWSVVSGPGQVYFVDAHNPATRATFSGPGIYLLRLAASDSLLTAGDEVTITVTRPNQAPLVYAGQNQLVVLPSAVVLNGVVTDDGLPTNAPLTFAWSQVSGPGTVTFANASATNTTAGFSAPGSYVLRLTADDSVLTNAATVTLAVRTPAMNEAPVVNAGPDKVVGLTNVTTLSGAVSDDGLPAGASLTFAWSQVSGPGSVTFDNSAAANTRATFAAVGDYVLRLTASDSALSAADDVTVTVYPFNQPPKVAAGPDQVIIIPDPSVLSGSGSDSTNRNTELSVSLFSSGRWNDTISHPGLTGQLPLSFDPPYVGPHGLSASGTNLYVCGNFTHAGGLYVETLGRWDGSQWHTLYDPRPANPANPASPPIEFVTLDGINSLVTHVAARGDELFVLGARLRDFDKNGEGFLDSSARWTGTGWERWNVFVTSVNSGANVVLAGTHAAYLAGFFDFQPTNSPDAGFALNPLYPFLPVSHGVARWNGTTWETLGDGIEGMILSLAEASNGDLYAGGTFTLNTANGVAHNVARWNGARWEALGSGLSGCVRYACDTEVRALAIGEDGVLYAGGEFTVAGGQPANFIAKWDGSTWSPLGSGPDNGVGGIVQDIVMRGRDIYVGGTFARAGEIRANNIARWNGQFWSPLGLGPTNGVAGDVFSLALSDDGLYVGGNFQNAGGKFAPLIALWEFPPSPARGASLAGRVTDDGLPTDAPLTVTWSKISGPGIVTFADTHSAQTTVTFSQLGSYVLRLSANDTEFTTLDEVTIEVRGNQPPVVDAGPDQSIRLTESARLEGVVTDDGFPDHASLVSAWTVISGPGAAMFEDPGDPRTTAKFSTPGTYLLRLSANDSQFSAFGEIVVTVLAANAPPFAFLTDQTVFGIGTITLVPTISDDGLPNGILRQQWSVVSGPTAVVFGDATAATTTATFYQPGVYHLRLTVTDGQLSTSREINVAVVANDAAAPIVHAGCDQTAMVGEPAGLQGTVLYNGDPADLFLSWSTSRGPTDAIITDPASANTTATFSQPGVYTLSFCAFFGWEMICDDVVVTVLPTPGINQAPVVYAGPMRTIAPGSSLTLQGRIRDDALPVGGTLTSLWTVVSAPGSVTFGDAKNPASTITFGGPGYYELELTAGDGELTASDRVVIRVANPAEGSVPPAVNAGSDQTITLPALANLNAITPAAGLVFSQWTVFRGPGDVTFSPSFGPMATAEFGLPGEYVLQFFAYYYDSEHSIFNSDDVIVTVNGDVTARDESPLVNAGPPLTVFLPQTATLAGTIFGSCASISDGVTAGWQLVSGPGAVNVSSTVTQPNPQTPGVWFATATAALTVPGEYVFSLTATNAAGVSNATVTVTAIHPAGGNVAPLVSAGPDVFAVSAAPFTLAGIVTDDGLPAGVSPAVMWSVVDGPGQVYFTSATAITTAARAYAPGVYHLRLSATDGQFSSSDELTLTVTTPTNEPPLVAVGGDLDVVQPRAAELFGAVFDDGRPLGHPLQITWSMVSGPGIVTFAPNPHTAFTSATFSAPGNYVLRLTADDSEFSDSDELIVLVREGANQPPVVSAGADFTADLHTPAPLSGTATDDGEPNGTLEIEWSKVGGPGTVQFSTLNGIYHASFAAAGDYVLRFTASDSMLTGSDEVNVRVVDAAGPPVVEILSPLDSSTITAPTVIIGTVQSAILQNWILQYRLKPAESELETSNSELETWTSLATGTTAVASAPLATFDPTLLLNGLYEIQLTATDLVGRTASTEPVSLLVDRNLKVGQFTLSFNDLTVPVAGIPIQVTRTYDSRDKRAGDFGIGWTLDLKNIRLQKNRVPGNNWQELSSGGPFAGYCLDSRRARLVAITFPDGRTEKFQAAASPQCQFGFPITALTVTYTPLANTRGSLSSAGGDEVLVGGAIPGLVDLFDYNATLYNPALFNYANAEGDVYVIDEREGLKSVTDRNGYTLTISSNGITHSNGQGVLFHRDELGRITNVVDAAGNSMRYHYDADGNLADFVDRVNQTNHFTYNPRHDLLTIIDARGLSVARNDFDAAGRLVRQTDAGDHTNSFTHDLNNRREIITDRLGNVTVHEYDENGNVVRTVAPDGGVTLSAYDASDNLVTTVDPLGRTNRFTFDAQDNRTCVTDALGHTTRFTYGAGRQLTSVTDPLGRSVTNTFDADGNLLTTRDPLGHLTSFTYSNGLVVAVQDALGQVMRFGHDAFGRVVGQEGAAGRLTTFTRDANGNVTAQTTARTTDSGIETLTTTFQYDALNRLTNATFPDGTSAGVNFDAIGKPAAIIDQLGRQTLMEYDELGRLTRMTYPDGNSDRSAYDAEGRRIATTDRLGQITQFDYDSMGRLLRTLHPDSAATTNYFDLAGQLIAFSDPRGNTAFFGYDAAGRNVAVTNALLQVNQFDYDAAGNLTRRVDALGRSTAFFYDALNRPTNTVFADGTSQTAVLDALGRTIAVVDQAGNPTTYGYDPIGRLTTVTNALLQVTRFDFNELGELRAQTDANLRTTTFAYDPLGRRTRRTLPGGETETYAWNAAGLLTSQVDFNGRTTRYDYDVMNRLTRKIPDGVTGEPTVSFAYNALGQRTNMVDASGSTRYRYDVRNRLVEKVKTWGALGLSVALNYAYDAGGNVTQISSSSANGTAVSCEYDALNRLSAVNDARLGRTQYTYDDAGNLQSRALPNGITSSYAHDLLNRLTNLTALTASSAGVAQYRYTLDPAGQRLSASETLVPTGPPRTIHRLFNYDATYRLLGETINGAPNSGSASYAYDNVGNRLTRTIAGFSPGTLDNQFFAYNADDHLNTDTYDANGNTLLGAGFNQTQADRYDFEDRLLERRASFNSQPASISLQYDGDGNRVSKTVNGATTFYVVDDLNPTGYAQVLEELVATLAQPMGGGPAVRALVPFRLYTWGHDLLSQDQLLDTGTNLIWSASFPGHDGHGSVRYLTDTDGTVTDSYDYDAFGNLIAQSGVTPNNFLHSGEQFDPDLGLYYLRARYHNPQTGRFWSMDSFEGFGADPASLHKYTYCGNNAVNCVDPSGQWTLTEAVVTTHIASMINVLAIHHGVLTTMRAQATLSTGENSAAVYAAIAVLLEYQLASDLFAATQVGRAAPTIIKFTFSKAAWAFQELGRLTPRDWLTVKWFAPKSLAPQVAEVEQLVITGEGVATAADKAAFWSGRKRLNRAAAELSGLTTLEKTPAGIALESQDLFSKLPYAEAIKPWETLSGQFASQAKGTVNAWTGGASPMSVWARIELPALRWNPEVRKIIIRDATQPWKTTTIYK